MDIPAEDVAKLVIAYEPIWAIGTGKTATSEQANETIGVIRAAITKVYGAAIAGQVRIQYAAA
jgi:triosephosphate isomerase